MLKNITYKQKFIALIGATIICFFVLYKYQIAHIFTIKKELESFDSSSTEQLFFQSSLLKQQIKKIDAYLINDTINTGVQQAIIKDIEILNEKQKLNSTINQVSDIVYNATNNHIASVFFLEINGSYLDILNTILHIENQVKYAKIISIDFYTKKNYNTQKKLLYAKVYIQSISKQ